MLKRLFTAACLSALILPSCREQEQPPEQPAPAADSAVVATLQQMTAQVQTIHKIIQSIHKKEDVAAAAPALQQALHQYQQCYASLSTAFSSDDAGTHVVLQELQTAFTALEETVSSDAFVTILWESPRLQYHLLLQEPDFPCVLDKQTADYMLQCQVTQETTDSPSTALRACTGPIYAEAAGRHAQFMAANTQQYAGGNGSSNAQAILLLPCIQAGEEVNTDGVAEKLMVDYMRVVYPQFRFGFGRYSFHPDGAYYSTKVQFPGLYTTETGETELIKFPVTFCRRLPGSPTDVEKMQKN